MFDIGAAELLVIVIVAILVIGPKDMPMAMRTAGRWIGKVRKVSSHFRTGIDAMVREAELEDMEKKWKAQNEAIMKRRSDAVADDAGEPVMTGPPPVENGPTKVASAKAPVAKSSATPDPSADDPPPAASAEAQALAVKPAAKTPDSEPELPLSPSSATKSKPAPSSERG